MSYPPMTFIFQLVRGMATCTEERGWCKEGDRQADNLQLSPSKTSRDGSSLAAGMRRK